MLDILWKGSVQRLAVKWLLNVYHNELYDVKSLILQPFYVTFILIVDAYWLTMFASYVQLDQRLALHKLDSVFLYHFPQNPRYRTKMMLQASL